MARSSRAARRGESASRPTTSPSTGRCCSRSSWQQAHGAAEVELIGDSELIVRQVKGEYRVKDPGLKPLHAEARRALGGLQVWSIRNVRREDNAAADDLVNATLDDSAS